MGNLELLTPEEAAAEIGCEPQHINELAARKEIPAVKFGRSWRFPAEALRAHLVQRALDHLKDEKPAAAGVVARLPERRPAKKKLPDLTNVVQVA